MSSPPLDSAVRSTFRTVLSVPFEVVPNYPDFEDLELANFPYGGKWTLSADYTEDPVTYKLRHAGVAVGSIGRDVKVTASLSWVDEADRSNLLDSHTWPPAAVYPGPCDTLQYPVGYSAFYNESKGYSAETQEDYLLEVVFEGSAPHSAAATATSLAIARRHPGFDNPSSSDVCFIFPHAKNRRLFTRRSLLTAASPYFDTLFSSGCSEAIVRQPGGQTESSCSSMEVDAVESREEGADSDDETDELYPLPPSSEQEEKLLAVGSPVHKIHVTETAYSTYKAVLLFLETGYIDFVPLASHFQSRKVGKDTTISLRQSHLHASLEDSRVSVFPASPSSVYALSHLLQLDDLRALSLGAFTASLTPSTAAPELVTPQALAYDELRAAVVQHLARNFDEVETSEAYKGVVARMKMGELPAAAAGAMAELVEELRLREKEAKDRESSTTDDEGESSEED
ncbi:hypothetical protein JCM10213_002578 [Rhodosporidiobolus nylandii]